MDKVEVTQADIDAVAAFHKASFRCMFETTDADIDAGINRAHGLLCQAFADHRAVHSPAATTIETLQAQLVARDAENEILTTALSDLVSWFTEPHPPEWRIRAGEGGADEAVVQARAALGQGEG